MTLDHVLVLMMENHSFDRALGSLFPFRPDGGGAVGTAAVNPDATTTPPHDYPQALTATREVVNDPGHDLPEVLQQLQGGNKGFVTQFATTYPASTAAQRAEIMGYYGDETLPVLHALAKHFTVCDRWFSSLPGPTWPNRFFVHSGTSLGHVDMPEGILHLNLHAYDQRTVYQELNARGISWKIYYGDIPQSLALTHQLGEVFRYEQMSRFFEDARGDERAFPQYCFIEPSYFGQKPNDQHPPHDVCRGEALIAQVYNALRRNDALWQRSLLVILYDEHGGFYDHVECPRAVPPDGNVKTFGFDQVGVRVPAILVSPWFEQGTISETFDHTSLLKFLADKWGFDPKALGNRTAAASTFAGHLLKTPRDTQNVLPSVTIPTYLPPQPQKELSSNQTALVALSEHVASGLPEGDAKQDLLRRAPEAGQGADPAFRLATDRLNAFLMSKGKLPSSLDPGALKPAVLSYFGVQPRRAQAPQGGGGIWKSAHTLAFLSLTALLAGVNLAGILCARTPFGPRPGCWIATILVLVGLLVVVGDGITGRFWGIFIDDRAKMSLSRFQLVAWTLVVVSALLCAALWNGLGPGASQGANLATAIRIPNEILYLLGISSASFVGAPMILQRKTRIDANPDEFSATAGGLATAAHPMDATQHEGQLLTKSAAVYARWTDLFRGDEVGNGSVVDMSKIQQFFFTLVLAFGYGVAIFRLFSTAEPVAALPPLDVTFVALLGISHAAYLGYKATSHSQDAGE